MPPRRKRKLLACTECRRRKLKCDRDNPCIHCIKSGSKCEYKSRDGTSFEDVHLTDLIDDESKFFDIHLKTVKRSFIASKPSRTLFLGHSSWLWFVLSRPYFRKLISGLDGTIHQEKFAWLSTHQAKKYSLAATDYNLNPDEINKLIQSLICPDYYAFQERLVYFQNHLNGLLFGDSFPMGIVHSLFLSYFVVGTGGPDPNNVGGSNDVNVSYPGNPYIANFIAPEKPYFYADISLITALVYLVHIFTRYNDEGKFHHQFSVSPDEFDSLSFKLLEASQFRRKKTQQALLSLIVLRASLFVYDNSEGAREEFKSYPMFQSCLDLCYQMGLHSDPDITDVYMFKHKLVMKTRLMSPSEVKELWNYMQMQDAEYSVAIGTPLLVSYDFCSGFNKKSDFFYDNIRQQGLLLMRELSLAVNSNRPISLRDLLALLNKVLGLCYQMPARMFLRESPTIDLDELANLCRLKLLLIQTIPWLCRMAMVGISEIYSLLAPSTETANILCGLCKEMYRQILISNALSLYHIKPICEGLSVFGPEKNGKYVIFFRGIIAGILGQCFALWFLFLLPRVTNNAELLREVQKETMLHGYPPPGDEYPNRIDLFVLEAALYHDFRNEDAEISEQLCIKLLSSSELMSVASSFYDVLCQKEVMKSSLDSFLMLKSILIWLYLVRTVEECKGSLDKKNMTIPDVIKRAKVKVTEEFNRRRLEDVSEQNKLEDQLGSIFDSIFVDDNWILGGSFGGAQTDTLNETLGDSLVEALSEQPVPESLSKMKWGPKQMKKRMKRSYPS
ncbi:DEKNAAC101800 [Brettanomyces naardenensis]|uniref:DEKNAAC101800 n=1 Tax=Brettanomyces naardenensis TaxID=13370 RepID=A0A448YJ92_BRENA|nr:DEKNAAC101800 [Brettanomyces naardenensis]